MKTLVNYACVVKLAPTIRQLDRIKQFGGNCRWLYNHLLNQDQTQTITSVKTKCQYITKLRQEYPWLKESHVHILQTTADHLGNAWNHSIKHKFGFPKFKKKSNNSDGFEYKAGCYIDQGQIWLPKIGLVSFHDSYRLPNQKLGKVNIKQQADGWYASILFKKEINVEPNGGLPVGIDLGITTFVTLSDGTKFNNLKIFRKYLRRLKSRQRRLSRKVKGSNNRKKYTNKLARMHQKVARVRRDWQHKLSTHLAKNHSLICVESLAVKNMVKNHCLAMSISDCAWSSFIAMLKYKCVWYGSELRAIDRWYPSSKTCSICHLINHELTLADRIWTCKGCGTVHDRDVNAAKNLLDVGTGGQPGTTSLELATPVEKPRALARRSRKNSRHATLESPRL